MDGLWMVLERMPWTGRFGLAMVAITVGWLLGVLVVDFRDAYRRHIGRYTRPRRARLRLPRERRWRGAA